jgi:hypothetical protein
MAEIMVKSVNANPEHIWWRFLIWWSSFSLFLGASGESVDLLPTPGLTTRWTKDLPTDDGKESDQIFYFDGKTNAVEVPRASFNHTLHKHFTISTWMKHTFSEEKATKKKSAKQHVLCMADGDGKICLPLILVTQFYFFLYIYIFDTK